MARVPLGTVKGRMRLALEKMGPTCADEAWSMSDHEEMESSVAAWVLGALDADEAETVRSHAEGCPTCREVAARLRRVVGHCRSWSTSRSACPAARACACRGNGVARVAGPPAGRGCRETEAESASTDIARGSVAGCRLRGGGGRLIALVTGVVIGDVAFHALSRRRRARSPDSPSWATRRWRALRRR